MKTQVESTITLQKVHQRNSRVDMNQQKKKSANVKTDQQRLYDPKKVRKKSEEKLTDLQRSVGNIEEIKIHVT